jgi:hypothetical protein
LWTLAENDLLDGSSYRLRDTGQGLNRMKDAPQVSGAMHNIIGVVQRSVGGGWVGSSVVHLGDQDVPNAFIFIVRTTTRARPRVDTTPLRRTAPTRATHRSRVPRTPPPPPAPAGLRAQDKYTQVPRILRPIVDTVDVIPALCEQDPQLNKWVQKEYGGAAAAQKLILADFFRHGFDGSGANNYYDAGSCIDGRLTSAWNWCSKLDKKPYSLLFRLAGHNGFDGDFSR